VCCRKSTTSARYDRVDIARTDPDLSRRRVVESQACVREHDVPDGANRECPLLALSGRFPYDRVAHFFACLVGAVVLIDQALTARLLAHLAGYTVPRHVVFAGIPKTSTGKIQKFKLREMAKAA